MDNLIARQRDVATPQTPTERRYRTSDTTVEKLAELLRENPAGILIQRDELTGWLKGLDRQGREVDRAFYLVGVVDVASLAEGTAGERVGVEAARMASAENPAIEGARALLSRIRKGNVEDTATIRDVYRKQWSRLSTAEEVSVAAAVLEDYGWLRAEKVETKGRPTFRLRLHPSLRKSPEGEA